MLKHLTTNDFKAFVEENKVCIIDFWATWCGPCRMLSPILEELNAKDNIPVGKVNVDEEEDIAMAFKIEAIPTLLLYMNGKQVSKRVGYMSLEDIRLWVKAYEG